MLIIFKHRSLKERTLSNALHVNTQHFDHTTLGDTCYVGMANE